MKYLSFEPVVEKMEKDLVFLHHGKIADIDLDQLEGSGYIILRKSDFDQMLEKLEKVENDG